MRFRRRVPYPFKHPVFSVFGVTGETISIDSMHTVDLGVTSHILGNVLKEIIYEQIAAPAKDACATVWKRIREIYDELQTPHRITHFGLKYFIDLKAPHKEYPIMKKVSKLRSNDGSCQ